jgi:hypothetical protein
MQEHRGKMKDTKFVILLLFLSALGAEKVAALPTLNVAPGFMNAWTNLNSSTTDTTGHHMGWSLSADASWPIRLPLGGDVSAMASPATSVLILPGLRGQFIDMGASNWLSDGSRYRAWSAFGLGPEVGIGFNINNFIIQRGQTFLVSAALLGNVAHYTQTSLYSAYISWLVEPSWELELNKGWALSASFPVEFAYRADGQSIISGIDIGVRYAF